MPVRYVTLAALLLLSASQLGCNELLGCGGPPPVSVEKEIAVTFCDLIRGAHRYDRKLVRVQAVYDSGVDTSTLTDPTCDIDEAWMRPKCTRKQYGVIVRAREEAKNPFGSKVRLDVVGRYYAAVIDPAPNQGFSLVHVLDITEIINAKYVDESR